MNGLVTLGREDDPAKALRKTWGVNIAETRKLRGMTREDLAAAVSVTAAAVGMWERGETAPRWHLQVAIADALRCAHGVIFVMRAA